MADNNGFLFYKKNYNARTGEVKGSIEIIDKITNSDIFNSDFNTLCNNCSFSLSTVYPGLLTGTGYTHYGKEGNETDTENAFKIGFYFDHTSGMPIIPGSSLKGVLRSVFPQFCIDDLKRIEKEKSETPKDLVAITKAQWIYALLQEFKKTDFQKEDFFKNHPKPDEKFNNFLFIHNLEIELFNHARNIYYDAIPVEIIKNNIYNQKKLFGCDAITPHIKEGMSFEMSQLKNPIPLRFLKILPNVVYQFYFKLSPSKVEPKLDIDKLKLLFQKILLTIGIGAKTNVGYGQFVPVNVGHLPKNNETEQGKIKRTKNEGIIIKHHFSNVPVNSFPTHVNSLVKEGDEFDGIVMMIEDGILSINFKVKQNNCVLQVEADTNPELRKFQRVKLTCQAEFDPKNPNFSVKPI
jgi:CRISPR-associated protein Cmr6